MKNKFLILVGAAAITLALFIVMKGLVAQDNTDFSTALSQIKLDFIPLQRLEDTKTLQPPPKPPAQKKQPPLPLQSAIPQPPTPAQLTAPQFPDSKNLTAQLSTLNAREGEALPLVRIQPIYPQAALARGTEGWVLVEFSVSKEGKVLAPKVIQAEPPLVFDNAALRAVLSWRYKPEVVNGQPQVRHKIQTRIRFELEQ